VRNCRVKKQKKVTTLQSPNKFEVLRSRAMNVGEGSGREVRKDRRTILREEKEKKRLVEVRKTKREEKSLRKVIVKIRLKRIDIQKGITVKALLNSGVTGLVMSSEFSKKKGFKLKKIKRLIYVRNMDRVFNKKRPIEYTVEINIYY